MTDIEVAAVLTASSVLGAVLVTTALFALMERRPQQAVFGLVGVALLVAPMIYGVGMILK